MQPRDWLQPTFSHGTLYSNSSWVKTHAYVSKIKVCLMGHGSWCSPNWTGTARTAGSWKDLEGPWRSHVWKLDKFVNYQHLWGKAMAFEFLKLTFWQPNLVERSPEIWENGACCEFCLESKNWHISNICRLTGIESWNHFDRSNPTAKKLWTSGMNLQCI